MTKIIIFILLLIVNIILLAALLTNGIRWGICTIRHNDRSHIALLLKRNGLPRILITYQHT